MLFAPNAPLPVRSSFGDDLFLRRHRGLGSPIHNQFVWRYDEALPVAGVDTLADALADGGLGRRADSALVPAARDRWSHSGHRPAVTRTHDVPPADALAWLRRHGSLDLDPARGRGWSLASADLRGGGALMSLVVSHAVADGGAMVDAVVRAGGGGVAQPAPPRPTLPAALVGDLRDAAGQVREVGRWLRARRARPAGEQTAGPPAGGAAVASPPSSASEAWAAPLVVAEVSTAAVAEVARRHGGTPNAWFVALVAAIAARTRPDAEAIPVALPVSAREPADLRANATRIARAEIATGPDLDLSAVRSACKAAYRRLSAARPADEAVPLALVQMLPDAVVRRLPQPPSAAALASNVGALPEAFTHAAGVPARSVAAIAHHAGAGVTEIRALGGGVAAWLCTGPDRSTVSVAGLDPDRLPDDEVLAQVVLAELDRWGLRASRW